MQNNEKNRDVGKKIGTDLKYKALFFEQDGNKYSYLTYKTREP